MNGKLAAVLEEWVIASIDPETGRQYEEALDSVRKYPFDIGSPQDLLKLNGFNKQLAKKLFDCIESPPQATQAQTRTKTLRACTPKDTQCAHVQKTRKGQENCYNVDDSLEDHSDDLDCTSSSDSETPTEWRKRSLDERENEEGTRKKKQEKEKEKGSKRQYAPKKGSSSYALLLGLFEAEAWKEESAVEKAVLIEKAKPHSNVALEPPDCKKPATVFRPKQFYYYSGWGTIKTLIGNGLVLLGKRKGTRKSLYYLSVDGVILAQKLLKENTTS